MFNLGINCERHDLATTDLGLSVGGRVKLMQTSKISHGTLFENFAEYSNLQKFENVIRSECIKVGFGMLDAGSDLVEICPHPSDDNIYFLLWIKNLCVLGIL